MGFFYSAAGQHRRELGIYAATSDDLLSRSGLADRLGSMARTRDLGLVSVERTTTVYEQQKSRPQAALKIGWRSGYLKNESAWARRLFTSSQFTTFHQAFK